MWKKLLALTLALTIVVVLCPAASAADSNYQAWRQGDAPWGSLQIGGKGSDTMSSSGCLITAVAKMLVYSGQQDETFTPGECLAALKECGMLSNGGSMLSGNYNKTFLPTYAPKLTHEPSDAHSEWPQDKAVTEVSSKLNNRYYVIVCVNNTATGHTHWMLVDRVESNDIYVMDNGGIVPLYGTKKYSGGVIDQSYFKYSSRSLLDLVRNWFMRSDSTNASTVDTLKICPTTAPHENMAQGRPFYFKGKITSGCNITSATISILSSDGKTTLQSKAIAPNKKEVDIATSGLDSLKFGQLSPGAYLFKLTATDSSGDSQTWSQAFSIKKTATSVETPSASSAPVAPPSSPPASQPSPSTLTISPTTKPSQGMTQGKPFYFKGKVTSNYSITSATISILSADGKTTLQAKTITPRTATVDIATSGLDSLKFGKLSPGSYLFKLTATDVSGNIQTWQQSFSIQGTASTLTIAPSTKPGQNMAQGKPFYFKGKITSNYSVTSASISILSRDGNTTYQTRTITPNKKEVDIATSGLDSLKFGKLASGSYLFRLTATDASGNTQTWQQSFSIR